MNYNNLHIPYDMKCGRCPHNASDHWASHKGKLLDMGCYKCIDVGRGIDDCPKFIFDNLNYIEVMAERKEQEKILK